MHTGGGSDDAAVGATVGVATALEDLKARGSALLVVGSVPEDVYARVSGCMLGDSSEDRRRLIVERGRSPDVRFSDVDRWTPEWTRILRCDVDARGSTAAGDPGASATGVGAQTPDAGPETPSGSDPRTADRESRREVSETPGYPGTTTPAPDSIAKLGVEISTAIDQLNSIAGGLEAAELRVAFDCATSLLAEYDESAVFRFLHVLANDIRRVEGMGHVRLTKPYGAEIVALLEPLFDAVVELRLDGTVPQQRWHFRDSDVTSEWLAVE